MLRRLLPHAAIIISLMLLVFLAIDRVNTMMNFINNDMTKALMLMLCALSIGQSVRQIRRDREAERQRQAARRRALEQRRRAAGQPQPRVAQSGRTLVHKS